MYKLIRKCRICDSKDLKNVFDLGNQPPANSLRKNKSQIIDNFPLKIIFCNNCKLVQLSATVEPKYLFDKYFWVTATSSKAQQYSNSFCKKVLSKTKIKKPFVFEIASNDGTFLLPFKNRSSKVIGVDPAKNIAKKANINGIPTINNYFNKKLANVINNQHGKPDIIIARNVIPHVKEVKSIVEGISNMAHDKTIVAIEFHYSKNILKELHYDSIYHEHLFYFSIKTISYLFKEFNLRPFDISFSPISGGSAVLYFKKTKIIKTNQLVKAIRIEEQLKLNHLNTWLKFSSKSRKHSENLRKIILDYSQNSKLVGFGASARSSTLLNYLGINYKVIDFIIDNNPLKKNMYTPGTDIKIISFKDGFSKTLNKNILLLAWNFSDEIIKNLKKNKFKGKIIVPLPNDVKIK